MTDITRQYVQQFMNEAENTPELRELSFSDLQNISNKEALLQSFDAMKDGQELYVPVAEDEEGSKVFYGPLDYSGKSNNLSEAEWSKFIEKITGFIPTSKTVLRKVSDINKMWIYTRANESIGPCDMIAVYPTLIDLIQSVVNFGIIDDEEDINRIREAVNNKDLAAVVQLCNELFNHSFFTGLIEGPFEYVSGPMPDADGYAS